MEPSTGAGVTVEALVAAVTATWAADDGFATQTVARMGEVAARFARRAAATGATHVTDVDSEVCRGFIDAPTRTGDAPSAATRHFRRTTLRALFRTGRALGVAAGDPTLDITLPARSGLTARPLTGDEVVLCRTATHTARATDLRRPTAWALAEATATTSEIPTVRRRDLTAGSAGWEVALPGSRRVEARTVTLTDWGAAVITRRLAELPEDPDTPLAYTGAAGEHTTARHAAGCALVAAVLTGCGLGAEADIRPASVRHWRARCLFDTGAALHDVARLLGHRSLDETAEAIGFDWRNRP